MLLPSKQDVDRSKILERRADIEQGKAITGRLDELRRVAAEESVSIEKARKEQVASGETFELTTDRSGFTLTLGALGAIAGKEAQS